MLNNNLQPAHSHLHIARKIRQASDAEIVEIIQRLRVRKELSGTVRTLNALLLDREHSETALLALRRLGLEHAG
jgi:hypothetical protein